MNIYFRQRGPRQTDTQTHKQTEFTQPTEHD